MYRLQVYIAFLIMLCTGALTAQQMGPQSLEQLMQSPAGSKIIAFLNLVNAEEEPQISDVEGMFSPRLVGKHGVEKLLGLVKEIRMTDGGLTLYEMKRAAMFKYEGVAKGNRSSEWLAVGYEFESNPPYRIDGFSIQQDALPVEGDPMFPAEGGSRPAPTLVLESVTPNSEMERSGYLKGRMLDLPKEVDDYVRKYTDLGIFSGVVLLADRGEVFYEKAFGLANREYNKANTIGTAFNIGSMNKDYTAIVVGQLVHEGLIALDSRLTDVIPGFEQPNAGDITIEHLLSHTSGLGDYFGFGPESNYQEIKDDPEKLLAHIKTLPLHFKPGNGRMYSNAGYVVLGGVIRALTGKSYADNVRERILKPLGLRHTYVEKIDEIPNRAMGYMQSTTGEVSDIRQWQHEPNPAGAFYATASDLLKFYQSFFYGEEMLPLKMKMELPLFRMIAPYYQDDRAAIPLAGGSNGVNSVICEMLGERISIIVLANMDEPVAEHVGLGILDIVRGDPPREPSLPAHMSVYRAYKEHGLDHIKDNWDNLTANFHAEDPKQFILNRAGYDLMQAERYREAIDLLSLNVELFPGEANCYDSLGEAYYRAGNNAEALKWYKKALDIDPNFPSALDMVEKLKQ